MTDIVDLLRQRLDLIDQGIVRSVTVDRHTMRDAATEIENLRSLLAHSECPSCDGRGWYVAPSRNTGEPEQVQCEWCDRVRSALDVPKDETKSEDPF